MSGHTTDSLERARAVLAAHADQLMAYPGVVSVGVGLRQRDGALTDEVCIVVMVRHKRDPASLPPSEVLPREIEGVPVDVQEAGDIVASPDQ